MSSESKTNETKIALLEANMQDIKTQVSETNLEVKSLSSKIESFIIAKSQETTQLQIEVRLLAKSFERLEKQAGFWRWFAPTLSAIFSAAITFLFINYLQNLK